MTVKEMGSMWKVLKVYDGEDVADLDKQVKIVERYSKKGAEKLCTLCKYLDVLSSDMPCRDCMAGDDKWEGNV